MSRAPVSLAPVGIREAEDEEPAPFDIVKARREAQAAHDHLTAQEEIEAIGKVNLAEAEAYAAAHPNGPRIAQSIRVGHIELRALKEHNHLVSIVRYSTNWHEAESMEMDESYLRELRDMITMWFDLKVQRVSTAVSPRKG